MELHNKINNITDKNDLVDFVEALRKDLLSNPNEWENSTLERFLESLAQWLSDIEDAHFEDQKSPNWRMVAEILYAGKIYE